MSKVLVIEDDPLVASAIKDWLEDSGHHVELAYDGTQGFELLGYSGFELAIVDWELPGLSGVEICSRFRKTGGRIPILMLTGKKMPTEKIQGLDSGADDYLSKPFDAGEFLARVRALLRRPTALYQEKICLGALQVDRATCSVHLKEKTVKLLPKEFELLEFLLRHPGSYFSAELLIKNVWDSSSEVGNEAIRTIVSRIRQKVDQPGQPSIIETAKGWGYKISDEFLRFIQS